MPPENQVPAGRKPPQAPEAEVAALAAMLLDHEAVPVVIQYLRPEHFYVQAHRRIFEAVCSLFEHGTPIDIVSVTSELKRMKELDAVGGQAYVSSLLDAVLTAANCEDHARLVLEKAVQRQLIQTATEIVQAGYDEASRADELLEEAEQKIFQIREAGFRKGFDRISDLLKVEWERIEQASVEKRFLTGIATGFHDVDERTSGLQRGELVIIAGRPSMGKTAFALNVSVHAANRAKVPVAVFSLEMSAESLVQRLLCAAGSVSMKNLRRGHLDGDERARLAAASGFLNEARIFIDDSPALNALDIRARSRRLKAEHSDLGLIVVDYLQLMESHGDRRRDRNRQQEISDTTRALKAMAKELNVPVIVLSQLSRAPEQRGGDKRPLLSDLRESGAIEQDADLVLLLYRGEFYEPDNKDLEGKAEAIIAKQRNGPLGTVNLAFLGYCMRFENPYGREVPPPEPESEDAPFEDALPE
jgi:replicative DNA helicase